MEGSISKWKKVPTVYHAMTACSPTHVMSVKSLLATIQGSSITRIVITMRTVSDASDVNDLWLMSPSRAKMKNYCVTNVTAVNFPPSVSAVKKPSCQDHANWNTMDRPGMSIVSYAIAVSSPSDLAHLFLTARPIIVSPVMRASLPLAVHIAKSH